ACLPLTDNALHYRHRREIGSVIEQLLEACSPVHTLIDAGSDEAGRFAVASSSPLLADYAAALKAGLDPFASPLVEAVSRAHPLPANYGIDGSLAPVAALPPARPLAQSATRLRHGSEEGDRLLETWLRPLD